MRVMMFRELAELRSGSHGFGIGVAAFCGNKVWKEDGGILVAR